MLKMHGTTARQKNNLISKSDDKLLQYVTISQLVRQETESVIAMLNELGWHLLSKRHEDARLIFYKIISNLAKVLHGHILSVIFDSTRKKNYHKFRHIGVTILTNTDSHFILKLFVAGVSHHMLIPQL